jgi:hypothetical protein
MQRRPHRSDRRVAGSLAALVALLAVGCASPAGAVASPRVHAPYDSAGSSALRAAAARVDRYWTPARMRSARPLDLVVGEDGEARLRAGPPEAVGARISYSPVHTPSVPPFSYNGRIFVRQGKLRGFCSGTAINSPTRQLVLTAGHCLNSGPIDGPDSVWANFVQFVPAYTGGLAPFGSFVARRDKIFAPKQWIKQGNPDFDMGAFLTLPNSEGVDVADAVGGGATIVTDLTRHQEFESFGYPGEKKRMQECKSPYIGDDLLSNPFPGPPTMAIRCHWARGASGGGWLISEGTEINGVNTYLHLANRTRTYGPYFSKHTVGKLVRGL